MKARGYSALLLCATVLFAQQQPTPSEELPSAMDSRPALASLGQSTATPAPAQAAPSPFLQKIEDDRAIPKQENAAAKPRLGFFDFLAPYRFAHAPALRVAPATRAQSLVHDGAIYLSLYDALALAIENNLDVEVARYNLTIAGTETGRAQGGGNLRPIDISNAESPTGVGGPGSPLLNSAAQTATPTTPTINDLTSLNLLTETQASDSVQSTAGYSAGPPVPALDSSLVGQTTLFQRSNGQTLTGVAGLGTAGSPLSAAPGTLNFVAGNYALVQGFGIGTQVELDLTNAAQVLFANQGNLDPFSQPNASFTVTQPLLRGFGRDVNLRYLKIANIDQKISRLGFYQQLIATVYGVARLYYDLVSLNENAQVKTESLNAARKLYEDDKAQVEQGTLAPLDLTQAQALVTSSELDLIQSQGLVRQQEVILKSQLSRQGTADPVLANLPIVPTDRIVVPDTDDMPPLNDLVSQALATRPDLAQAGLQVASGRISVNASQNQTRGEFDLIANFQTRGSSELPFATVGTPGTGLIASPADLGVAGLRLSRVYQAGVQFNVPVRNRAAEADAARDILQLRQAQARTQRLANDVRSEVESSLIALQTARAALSAATQSRIYQEQLVQAERDRLSVGASTNLLVIQQQAYLAQARSTEVVARSVWIKARVALDRAVGNLLERHGISYDDSVRGELPAR